MGQVKYLRWKIVVSVSFLLLTGHILAKQVSSNKQTAWIFVSGFYAIWLIVSLVLLLKVRDIKEMFSESKNRTWNFVFVPVVVLIFIFVFVPNLRLLKWNYWLILNCIICLVNPFIEEIYWRGLVSKISDVPLFSFLFSSLTFAAGHSLLFGINSPGVAGLVGFVGAYIVGSLFWICYYKTKSLRGCVVSHFMIDVAGMAVFILAGKAALAPV